MFQVQNFIFLIYYSQFRTCMYNLHCASLHNIILIAFPSRVACFRLFFSFKGRAVLSPALAMLILSNLYAYFLSNHKLCGYEIGHSCNFLCADVLQPCIYKTYIKQCFFFFKKIFQKPQKFERTLRCSVPNFMLIQLVMHQKRKF